MTRRSEARNEQEESRLWDAALVGAHEANRIFDAMQQPGISEEEKLRNNVRFNSYCEAVGYIIGPSVLGVDCVREPGVSESETEKRTEPEPEHQKSILYRIRETARKYNRHGLGVDTVEEAHAKAMQIAAGIGNSARRRTGVITMNRLNSEKDGQ